MSTPFLSTPVLSTPAIVCQYFYVSHFKYFYFTRISCSASLTTSLPGPAQNIFGRGLETRLTIMTMASLVLRPPPFFVLQFAYSIIHNTSRSIKEINQGTSAATQWFPEAAMKGWHFRAYKVSKFPGLDPPHTISIIGPIFFVFALGPPNPFGSPAYAVGKPVLQI